MVNVEDALLRFKLTAKKLVNKQTGQEVQTTKDYDQSRALRALHEMSSAASRHRYRPLHGISNCHTPVAEHTEDGFLVLGKARQCATGNGEEVLEEEEEQIELKTREREERQGEEGGV